MPSISESRADHNTGAKFPTFCDQCAGSLTLVLLTSTEKRQETWPMAYRPYSRSLECLTICRCHSKGAQSLQLFQDPECWSRLDLEPSTSPTAGALQHELTKRRFFTNR